VKIKWLPSAEADADNIVGHLDPLNPAAARRMIRRIQQAVEKLRPHPFMARNGRAPETRELVVTRTPYIVIYSVEEGCVVIRRVLHTSRQWPLDEA
jgi:toxin ParE1/3/4